ncbi:hypothetical protein HELRODRAFT_166553 [Helobdella robusta]|uniref:Macro domain-containing protein n=1 Tax=Helobdella robusta TaxID=6412 RepID=T1EY87_HELRO|nr:hypothetical protein HELRODRAFT_166553 [Helobdella robusta]ESO11552.1 hypothetical protein HELRODRAFT_166553 [Helobdella robusta]
MNKLVEKRIDDNLQRACRILRDQADAMKQRMIECEEKVAFADKDQQNKKISFEIKYVEPDLKNIDASKLIGDIIITENVTTIVSGAASSEISDRTEIGRRKFFELKNSKDCKFLYACADVTEMKSDVLLVFVDRVTKTNPILDHILKNAGEQVRREFSQSVLFSFPYFESSMHTKAGSLPAQRIYYIVTDSGISRQSEHELYDYIIKKLENIFKDYKWSGSKLTSLTVSLDYGKHLQCDGMKFASVLNNAIINHLIDLNCEGFNVNFLTDCKSFVDLMAPKMQSLINMDNEREIKFRSGTCLQLSSKNLFDLKADALVVIADHEFHLFTDLGLKVKKIAGTDFENEIVDKLKNLGRRTVLINFLRSDIIFGLIIEFSFIIKSLKSFMKETFDIVREKNLESLAMPLLGTGGFGLLVHQCLEILCENFSENNFGRVFISIPIEYKEHTTIKKCENYLLRADAYLKMKKLKWSVERASSLG